MLEVIFRKVWMYMPGAVAFIGVLSLCWPRRLHVRRRLGLLALWLSAGLLGIGAYWIVRSAMPVPDRIAVALFSLGLLSAGAAGGSVLARRREGADHNALFANHGDGIFRMDERGMIVEANASAGRMMGKQERSLRGKTLIEALKGDPVKLAPHIRHMLAGEPQRFEFFARRQDGERIYVQATSVPMMDEGRVSGAYCQIEDRTERRALEEKVYFLAYHDELTGLPNRRQFAERLTEQLELGRIKTSRTPSLAVAILSIDRFKYVNDSIGQSSGDAMIIEAASRLERFALGVPGACSGRLGSDEYALFLPVEIEQSEAYVLGKMDELICQLERPYSVREITLNLSFSMGISLAPDHGGDAEGLMQKAETAMLSVKHSGRHQIRMFSEQLERHAQRKLEVEHGLRLALARNEFEVYYQPMIDLSTGRVNGAEALVRWRHPDKGMIPPGAFIPIAEESGLIKPIGEWVLREACRQNKAWQDAGIAPIVVSVNLSMQQFEEPYLVETVEEILKETGLNPQYLDLEITETMAMTADYTVDRLTRLKKLGIRLSMDDFGTGYSSLSYLQRFPIDKLKIDQSFVQEIGQHQQRGSAIVATIVAMAHHLQMQVIAEGVENVEQVDFLKSKQCDQLQGFWYSPPLPADQFGTVVGMQLANGAWAAGSRTAAFH